MRKSGDLSQIKSDPRRFKQWIGLSLSDETQCESSTKTNKKKQKHISPRKS